jgi:hypothetical protein
MKLPNSGHTTVGRVLLSTTLNQYSSVVDEMNIGLCRPKKDRRKYQDHDLLSVIPANCHDYYRSIPYS